MDESIVKHLEQQVSTADILRRAKAIIGTPDKWCHGRSAVSIDGKRGCIGCAIGAAMNASGRWDIGMAIDSPAFRLMDAVVPDVARGGGMNRKLYRFNADPDTTHDDVMRAFDRAIAIAETQGY